MLILSIDVGIKNLAYCILETNHLSTFSIVKWDVVNLCQDEPVCGAIVKNSICNKKASYVKNQLCFCKTHAKTSSYLMPDKSLSGPALKKESLESLVSLAKKHHIDISGIKYTKKDFLSTIIPALKENTFDIIKKSSASEMGLVNIGIAIQRELDKCIPLGGIKQIIIENQLSPLASRMKTIQGMLSQYFIMRGLTNIVFVSATNKLRPFLKNNNKKPKYAERKVLSIQYTTALLSLQELNKRWLSFVTSHTKKDDLADAFLQGIWYLNYHKYLEDKLFENLSLA